MSSILIECSRRVHVVSSASDLTAISAPGVVQPGDVVLLAGGTYVGAFTWRSSGRPGAPITIMNAEGQNVVLDRALSEAAYSAPVPAGLTIEGSYITVRENPKGGTLRITNSAAGRDLDALHYRPESIRVEHTGSRCRLINLRLDNGGGGVVANVGAADVVTYGCIITRAGWDSPARGSGHGVYLQNQAGNGHKLVQHCFIANGYGHGVHTYGGSAAKVQDCDVEDCIVSLCSSASMRERISEDVIFDGDPGAVDGCAVRRSVLWQVYPYPAEGGARQPALRVGGGRPELNGAIEFSDNLIYGVTLLLEDSTALRVRGNQFRGFPQAVNQTWLPQPAGYIAFRLRYPDNVYADAVEPGDMPAATVVYPNAHERGRGHVVIVNGSGANIVTVDLSSVCEVGQSYEIRDVERLEAPSTLLFSYQGGAVPFEMIRPTATPPIGGSFPAGRGTGVYFGCFLIREA